MALASIQLVIAVFFVMGAGLLHGQNLLTNGGFESGINTGWTHNTIGGAEDECDAFYKSVAASVWSAIHFIAFASCLICSGVVPQHPPMIFAGQ